MQPWSEKGSPLRNGDREGELNENRTSRSNRKRWYAPHFRTHAAWSPRNGDRSSSRKTSRTSLREPGFRGLPKRERTCRGACWARCRDTQREVPQFECLEDHRRDQGGESATAARGRGRWESGSWPRTYSC